MIVQSFGALQSLTAPGPTWGGSNGSVNLYGQHQAYAEIYRRQPNVRTCVDFLSRNIAQLGLPVFRRVSDTDRERLTDHDLARWLGRPNPSTRRYRLIESLMGDLGIYFNAYWLKVRYRDADRRPAIGLVRLPPAEMDVEGGLLVERFCWTANGRKKDFEPSEIVHFDGYNPLNPLMGLSPLETLRRILAEEAAAGEHREVYWRNAGRMESVIEQTKEAPTYTPTQQQQFREQFQEFSTGGNKAGMTPVLPKGMTLKPWAFSAKDSEYLSSRKLSREECAAAYHIPLPMVGILEHATFSNIKEQHKHLYADCLGPWLEMIQQEIEGQLLTECDDQRDVYVEFNIAAKLAGSFEEQANSLSLAIGKPWMTANEGRAKQNLPSDPDPESDKIAAQQGGPASNAAASQVPYDDNATALQTAPVLRFHRARQQARLNKLAPEERALAFVADVDRWNRELATDLAPMVGADAAAHVAAQANAEMLSRLETEAQHA